MDFNNANNISRLNIITGNDSGLAQDFVRLFVAQITCDVISLEHALKQNDHINIRRTARKMTSSLDVFGFRKSGHLTREIDRYIKENFSVNNIIPLVHELKHSLNCDRIEILKSISSS